ncbi:hypothetical protein SAMN05880590_107330 [Rhizobium sp. RU35A]|nr:hypothetical protein SAMN05880590_107330 [Rhizobium sp. RU35A]
MQYLHQVVALNPYIVGALVLVLACGAYDKWLNHH